MLSGEWSVAKGEWRVVSGEFERSVLRVEWKMLGCDDGGRALGIW